MHPTADGALRRLAVAAVAFVGARFAVVQVAVAQVAVAQVAVAQVAVAQASSAQFSVAQAAVARIELAKPSATRAFHADLAAEWQTRYTESPATGRAEFQLDLATLELSWTLDFAQLSGPPQSITLHAPAQPGANGARILELAPAGARGPVRGKAVISAAQVQYLLFGWSYINITTARFPRGEIRGQLDVTPATTAAR